MVVCDWGEPISKMCPRRARVQITPEIYYVFALEDTMITTTHTNATARLLLDASFAAPISDHTPLYSPVGPSESERTGMSTPQVLIPVRSTPEHEEKGLQSLTQREIWEDVWIRLRW